jgi:uncharacterized membrane protein (DUF4010 family)
MIGAHLELHGLAASISREDILATVSNTAVKGIIVLAAGTAVLRRVFLPGFILILITGIGAAVLL